MRVIGGLPSSCAAYGASRRVPVVWTLLEQERCVACPVDEGAGHDTDDDDEGDAGDEHNRAPDVDAATQPAWRGGAVVAGAEQGERAAQIEEGRDHAREHADDQ